MSMVHGDLHGGRSLGQVFLHAPWMWLSSHYYLSHRLTLNRASLHNSEVLAMDQQDPSSC
jgi:hypothetical protein